MKQGWLFPLIVLPAFGQTATPDRVQLPDSPSHGLTLSPGGAIPDYRPVTADRGVRCFVATTASPSRPLIVGPISAGWGTLRNIPSEYGTHWDGFGKRNGDAADRGVDREPDRGGAGVGVGRGSALLPSQARGLRPRAQYVLKPHFWRRTGMGDGIRRTFIRRVTSGTILCRIGGALTVKPTRATLRWVACGACLGA